MRLRRRSGPGYIGAPPRRRGLPLPQLALGAVAALAVGLALPGLTQPPIDPGPLGRLATPTLPVTATGAPSPHASPGPTDDAGDTIPIPAGPSSLPPERLGGYRWPVRDGRVTTWFAPTDGGFVVIDGERVHDGIDIATFCGDTVRAAHAGTVLYGGRRYEAYLGYDERPTAFYELAAKKKLGPSAFPIVVVVDDGNGYRSFYVHLSRTLVREGDHVSAGQPIGREGATGHATGCHLHYGLIRMDGSWLPVAPDLVRRWHYPARLRERIDPLRVLSLYDEYRPRQLPGVPPPVVSPGYGPLAPLLEAQRLRHEAQTGSPD